MNHKVSTGKISSESQIYSRFCTVHVELRIRQLPTLSPRASVCVVKHTISRFPQAECLPQVRHIVVFVERM